MLDATAAALYIVKCDCGAFVALSLAEKVRCGNCDRLYGCWIDYTRSRCKTLPLGKDIISTCEPASIIER